MKLHTNNEIHNLINENDINLADGTTLSAKLSETQQQINDLKNNVKWLYKYGGVGGSGSGGGSSKLTARFEISYTNTANLNVVETISANSMFIIKQGTPVTVKCTITSSVTLSAYGFSISGLKTSEKKVQIQPADSYSGMITFNPTENDKYTIGLNGEKRITRDFQIFTSVYSQESGIKYGDYTILNNNEVAPVSNVDDEKYYYYFKLNSFQPDKFHFEFQSITVNGVEQNVINEVQEDTTTGTLSYFYKIPFSQIFKADNFGVFKFKINYIFGNTPSQIEESYIYKDKYLPFVYCYGDVTPVYYNKPGDASAIVSNNYLNSVSYLIYGASGDAVDEQYVVNVRIEKQFQNSTTAVNISNSLIINTIKTLSITNNDIDWPEPVKIIFNITTKTGNILSYTYYLHLIKPLDATYILKLNNGKNAYNSVYSDTEGVITPSLISGFPAKNNSTNLINITSTYTCTLGDYVSSADKKQMPSIYVSEGTNNRLRTVHEYITNDGSSTSNTNAAANFPDIIYTMGIKYGGYSYDDPIISLQDSKGNTPIVLYKNKITNGAASIYTDRFCIPNDNKFHLVQIYVKNNYISGNDEAKISTASTQTSYATVFIDGVMETAPFKLNRCCNETKAKWIFHAGSWEFNYLGIMCFYTQPSILPDNLIDSHTSGNNHPLFKYLNDFDPIIPVVYYSTYSLKYLAVELPKIDASIYTVLQGSNNNWINYFNVFNRNDKTPHSVIHKFIPIYEPSVLINLCNIPAYCISPDDVNASGYTLNTFLENTFNSYEENQNPKAQGCSFYKWKDNKFIPLINDERVKYEIGFQGSSTLLYSVKNFEISTVPYKDDAGDENPIYFTPNKELFPKLEQSFNFKADIVDSSHSNNVIIGNFVHAFTEGRGPFGKDNSDNYYRPCLTGQPVLLFIENNTLSSNSSSSSQTEYLFLGIYSLNLNRGSVNNLGYSKVIDPVTKQDIQPVQDSNFEEVQYFITSSTNAEIDTSKKFRVAEVQGNSSLYDFSQYANPTLLSVEMFDDFFNLPGETILNNYDNSFSYSIKVLAKYIKEKLIDEKIFGTFNYIEEFKNNAYKPAKQLNLYFYEYDDNGQIQQHSITLDNEIVKINNEEKSNEDVCVVWKTTFAAATKIPYRHLTTFTNEGNTYTTTAIPDPEIQAFILTNKEGVPQQVSSPDNPTAGSSTNYLYLFKRKTLTPLDKGEENIVIEKNRFSVRSLCDYYVICMAFAMADSVLKNLTFKCPNYDENNISTWYLGFYDMDTAFGVSNSGGNVSFQAFSDYVSESSIIQDYVPQGTEEWYDIPSTYLFLFAKYMGIIEYLSLGTDEKEDITKLSSSGVVSPFYIWSVLRNENTGLLRNADYFYKEFVDPLYSNIHPLIWNLNFLYKYFSLTMNTKEDTEIKRFHGTRKAIRKEWLDKRLKYLDVMFGYKANRYIGASRYSIATNDPLNQNNPDITIYQSMFPKWTKGTQGPINVTVKDIPRTPLVLQSDTNSYSVQLTNNSGEAIFSTNISSDVQVGFYGTTTLKYVNECGQFLKSSEVNTLTNNVIKDITINQNNITSTTLDLKDLQSVKNITFDRQTIIKPSPFNITCSDRSLKIILDTVNLSNLIVQNGTISVNFSNDVPVNIKNLIISKCQCDKLELKGIEVDSLTIDNNIIQEYDFSNLKTKSISITDHNTNTLTLQNIECTSNISINSSGLKKLVLQNVKASTCSILSNVKLFTSDTGSIVFSNLQMDTLKIRNISPSGYLRNYIEGIDPIDLTLNFNKDINLSLIALPIKKLYITGNENTKISVTYIEYGLAGCFKLEDIEYNYVNYVYINTSQCFQGCTKLSANARIRPIFKKNNNNPSYAKRMFAQTSLETEDGKFFPTEWFKAHKDDVNKCYDFTEMFTFCPNEKYYISSTDRDNYINNPENTTYKNRIDFIFNTINEFNTALSEYLNKEKCIANYMFKFSVINVVTKEFTELIENYIEPFGIGNNNTNIVYIEKGSLDKMEQIIFGGTNINNSWVNQILIAFNRENNKINFNYSSGNNCLSNFGNFTESILIEQFNPYNSRDFIFDFDQSFPSTLKFIKVCTVVANVYVKNICNGFKNVSRCVLLESFRKGKDATYYGDPEDLNELLFNEDGNFRIILGQAYDRSLTTGDYNFNKFITYDNLVKFLNKVKEEKDTISTCYVYSPFQETGASLNNIRQGKYQYYSNGKSLICLSGIFKYCEVTNCPDNIEEIVLDLNGIWTLKETFMSCKFTRESNTGGSVTLPLNVVKSFKNADNKVNSMTDLTNAFSYTYLTPLTEALNIKCNPGLDNEFRFYFKGSFSNSTYAYTDYVSTYDEHWWDNIENGSGAGIIFQKQRRADIIPKNFFNIQNANYLQFDNCFAYSAFTVGGLTGQINTTSFDLSNTCTYSGHQSLFTRCNVSYIPKKITENVIEYYYIFPDWYSKDIKCFEVQIPLGTKIENGEVAPKYKTYLFDSCQFDLTGCILPDIPPTDGDGDLYYENRVDNLYKGYIQIAPDRSVLLLTKEGGPLKGILHKGLALVLDCDINKSIQGINDNEARSKDKTIIIESLADYNKHKDLLFKGALASITNTVNIVK